VKYVFSINTFYLLNTLCNNCVISYLSQLSPTVVHDSVSCMVDYLLIFVGHLAWTIVKGPLEAVIGILYGTVFGIILWYLPHSKHVRLVVLFFMLPLLVLICQICF